MEGPLTPISMAVGRLFEMSGEGRLWRHVQISTCSTLQKIGGKRRRPTAVGLLDNQLIIGNFMVFEAE